jgi:hypothetical protein
MQARTFENCWCFAYMATNHQQAWVKHLRNTFAGQPDKAWRTVIRSQDGTLIRESYRSSEEMRHIFGHMQLVAECSYYS